MLGLLVQQPDFETFKSLRPPTPIGLGPPLWLSAGFKTTVVSWLPKHTRTKNHRPQGKVFSREGTCMRSTAMQARLDSQPRFRCFENEDGDQNCAVCCTSHTTCVRTMHPAMEGGGCGLRIVRINVIHIMKTWAGSRYVCIGGRREVHAGKG